MKRISFVDINRPYVNRCFNFLKLKNKMTPSAYPVNIFIHSINTVEKQFEGESEGEGEDEGVFDEHMHISYTINFVFFT